jgi:TolB-like protein
MYRFCLSAPLSAAILLFFILPAQAKLFQPSAGVRDTSAITLAVMDFKNNSGLFSLDVLEKSVSEMLKTELSGAGSRLFVVERQKLEALLQEQALGQTGALDEKTAQQVGRLAGAQFLVNGEINLVGSRLRIDAHILKVETGQVRAEKVIGPGQEAIADMVRLLAGNIIFNLTGADEYRQDLRLKQYPTGWFLLATAFSTAAAGAAHWAYQDAYQQYQSDTQLDEFDTDYNRANNFRKARNGLVIVSGVLALATFNFWSKNHSDDNAILAGRVPEKAQPTNMMFVAHPGEIRIGLQWCF